MSDERISELKDRLLDLNEQIQLIQAKADSEDRDLTEEESKQIENRMVEFDATENEIGRRERIENQTEKLRQTFGPKSEPNDPQPQNKPRDVEPQNHQRKPRQPRIEIIEDRGKWGFRSFGEFAVSVKNASDMFRKGMGEKSDPRLIHNAPTTYGNEGAGADGGFAVPPDFRQAIMEKVMGEDSLIGRTDQMTTSSNSITFPKDETTPWQTSGGIQTYWDGEADQLTQSKLQLKEESIRLNKLTSLVPVTEELLEDAGAMDSYLRRKVPEKMDFAINNAIVNGTGVGKPKGILNADALVSVARESGQAADTLIYENIVNMYSRMYAPSRRNAVWLLNQDIEPQLFTMEFPTTTGASAVPAYMPPRGLADAPFGTLMGRPILPTEACQTLGDKGDIIFADLSQYLTVVKTGGIRSDVSIHLWFDYDTVAYRFILRIAGQPWWSAAISKLNGSNTLGCFVTLDERA